MIWQWLIPLVVVAVVILSSLVRTAQKPPDPRQQLRRPQDEPPRQPRPPADMDRFLAEVRERRQRAEQLEARRAEAPPMAIPVLKPAVRQPPPLPEPDRRSAPPVARPVQAKPVEAPR